MSEIWHTTNEKPMLHRDIILCGDGWSMAIDIIPKTVNNICWKNVKKWCYLDDLIKENNRTRKALDVAVGQLKKTHDYIEDFRYQETNYFLVDSKDVSIILDETNEALEQITALEQKDK